MKKFLFAILAVLFLTPAMAQWTQLKSVRLSSSDYESMVYTGSAVISASEGGLFRSADNGITWNPSVAGLDTMKLESWDITWLQARGEVWISGNALYKSTDHGLTWNKVTLTGLAEFSNPVAVTHVVNRLIIIVREWDNILSSNVYKLCYSDNGTSWSYGATLGSESVSRWSFIQDDNNYAAYIIEELSDGSGSKLWYSANGTSHVLHSVTGLPTDARIRDRAFTVDPAGTNLFFSDEKSMKFYRYNPLSTSWSEKMTGIGGTGLTIAGVLDLHNLGPHQFGTVIFTDALMQMSVKLFHSTDLGENWTAVDNPGVSFPVFEDPMIIAGDNRIIGNCFNAHIAYSDNSGQTWTKVYTYFGGEFRSLAPLPSGSIFTFTNDQEQGIIKSIDNGSSWTVQNGDLPNFAGIYIIDAIFSVGTTLYAVISEDPFAEKSYIYKSTNEGVNWTKITAGPDTKAKWIAGRHGLYPIIYFTDDGKTGTYQYTPDEGANWVNLSPVINALGVEKVEGFRSNGVNLILFGRKADKTRVYLSTNNGGSYTDITFNLDVANLEIPIANRYEWRLLPNAVAGYKADGTEFITAVTDYTSFPWSLDFYRLKPTADGWVKAGTLGLLIGNTPVYHSLRNNGNVWFFTTSVGVYASADNTASWRRVWNNEGFLMGVKPGSLVINNNSILLGTLGTGLWKAPISAPSLSTLPATDIVDVSATASATVVSTGGLPFIDKGFCWATHTAPTTSDNVLFRGSSWAGFTGSLQPLLPLTTYYVRSFVNGPKGTTYGNEVFFTTTTSTGLGDRVEGVKISVYPNPASEVINIMSDAVYRMSLFNVDGRNVMNCKINPGVNSIPADRLPAGIYFIRLKGTDGFVKSLRVVIR